MLGIQAGLFWKSCRSWDVFQSSTWGSTKECFSLSAQWCRCLSTGLQELQKGSKAICYRRTSSLSQAGLLEAGKQLQGKLKKQWEWRNEECNEGGQGGHPCNTVCVATQRPVWKAQLSWMQSPGWNTWLMWACGSSAWSDTSRLLCQLVAAKVMGKQHCGRVILMGYTLAARLWPLVRYDIAGFIEMSPPIAGAWIRWKGKVPFNPGCSGIWLQYWHCARSQAQSNSSGRLRCKTLEDAATIGSF